MRDVEVQLRAHPTVEDDASGLLCDEIRDSMNWSIGNRRFWLNSRIASFWLARSCERVETRR